MSEMNEFFFNPFKVVTTQFSFVFNYIKNIISKFFIIFYTKYM